MASPREWVLKIIGDTSEVDKSIEKVKKQSSGWTDTAKGIGAAVGTAFAIDKVSEFGKAVINAGSDTEQALGASQSVFKDYAGEIEKFSTGTAKNLGLSQQQFLELATKSGALLKNAGVPLQETTKATEDLTTRAADMAAMFGGPVSDSMDAINAALKGETDPIEKYGVSIKESAVNAKALSMGLVDSEGKVTDYGKAMARVQLIMDQTADSQGTFKRESGTLAGQTAIMSAQFKDMQATLGQQLLPVITSFMNILMSVVNFVSANQDWLTPIIAGIAAMVIGIKAWTIAQTALNLALSANPIGLIIIGIVALVAAIVALYMKVDWFRDFVDKAIDAVIAAFKFLWEWIVRIGQWIWDALMIYLTPWRILFNFIKDNWDTIVGVVRTTLRVIGDILQGAIDIVSAPFRIAKDLIVGYFNFLFDTFNKVRGWLYDAFRALESIMTAPFRAAFDTIKWLWNTTIGGFGFSVPSWIPGVGGNRFEIPRMATGGIVTRPTVALIGEAGPEAVVPLSQAGAMGSVTINVYALTANAEVGKRVVEALREYQRTGGGANIYNVGRLS